MTKATKLPIKQPGENSWAFKLGDRVKDKINGLEGTATSRFFHVTGCDRFAVELDAKDDKPGEVYHVAAERLDLVEAKPDRHRNEVPDTHVKLGDVAKAVQNGITGTIDIIHVPLFGSPQASINPLWDPKEKKMPDGYFVDLDFIEIVKPYDERPKAETKPKPTGEPGCSRMGKGYNAR